MRYVHTVGFALDICALSLPPNDATILDCPERIFIIIIRALILYKYIELENNFLKKRMMRNF